MKYRLLFLYILACICFSANAQTSVMTVSRDARKGGAKDMSLNGMAGAVFYSASPDLVITTPVIKDKVCDTPEKDGTGYRYVMHLDISGGNSRKFKISKKGTAIGESTGQVLLKKNEYVYFNVEIVDNPITIEQSDDGSHYLQSGNGWALIEINSEIKLQISYNPELQARIKSGRSKAGIYVDSLIIKIDDLQDMAGRLHKLSSEVDSLKRLEQKLLNSLDSLHRLKRQQSNVSDAEIEALENKLTPLEPQIKKQEEAQEDLSYKLNQLSYVSIKGEGTNERIIDPESILALQSKGKLRYNVMLLSKTVSVFKTKYEEMLNQAVSHKNSRDYAAAKMYYENAAQAEGASESDKQAALQSAQQMDKLAKFKAETDATADKLYELSANNRVVNKEAFIKMIDDMVERYNALHRETGDKFYQDEAQRLLKEKGNLGFVFKGKCVLSEYKGGQLLEYPVSGIVYIYGSQSSKCDDMDDKDYPFKGELITTITEPGGRYSFTLKPGQYKTIIFEIDDKKIKKNKHVSVEGRTDDRNVKVRFAK
ncbi:MAG: hypothetical protein IIV13_06385 [Bacteroidaceae bacterium]|nr:hypothetical protein [Bacteroidaceae bacterium]